MLLASWLGDQFGNGTLLMMIIIAVVIQMAKKFGNSNPDVKDTAKKLAAAKAISLLTRFLK